MLFTKLPGSRTLNRSSLRFIQESQLAKSLLHLDISNNSIEFVEALPPNAHVRIAFNKVKLRLAKGVLTQAGGRFGIDFEWFRARFD